ncbi:MAG: OmpA family protein [Candidatus Kapaibacterium sp.]
MKYIFVFLFFLAGINISAQEIDFRKPLTSEYIQFLDKYIKDKAPSDSAMMVVEHIANQHKFRKRYMVAWKLYSIYRSYFPDKREYFNTAINNMLAFGLTQTPTEDYRHIYDEFIRENPSKVDIIPAMHRLSDNFIAMRMWDSAAAVYKSYLHLTPKFRPYIKKIIDIIETETDPVKISNLENINSVYDEWDPNPASDGSRIYFSSNIRKGSYGRTDVWFSSLKDGQWQKPQNLGPQINGKRRETIDNITIDGNTLLLSGDFEGTFGNFDIYHIDRMEDGWGQLIHYPYPINTEHTDESANITADGNAMIFTSDRPGGIGNHVPFGLPYFGSAMGNMDIYVSFRSDTGWSQPLNLGTDINTPYAERSAYLHPDGKTLYFSSNGHPGLGRLDVFKAVRLKEDSWTEWSVPQNLGREINTSDDDWGYKVGLSGDSAFFASKDRFDSKGGWDLYTVTLPREAQPEELVIVRGKVTDSRGKPLFCEIKWEDLERDEKMGTIRTDPKTGNYLIALPLGRNYGFFAEKSGYYPASRNIDLRDIKHEKEIYEHVILNTGDEVMSGKEIIVNNIFFDYNKYDLKKESYPELKRLYNFMVRRPGSKVLIMGHTDDTGSDEYNMDLSVKRAKAVANYLYRLNKSENNGTRLNLEFKGFGSSKPVADNDTDSGRSKNRRVEFKILD